MQHINNQEYFEGNRKDIHFVVMECEIPLVYLRILINVANHLKMHPDDVFLLALDKFFKESPLVADLNLSSLYKSTLD